MLKNKNYISMTYRAILPFEDTSCFYFDHERQFKITCDSRETIVKEMPFSPTLRLPIPAIGKRALMAYDSPSHIPFISTRSCFGYSETQIGYMLKEITYKKIISDLERNEDIESVHCGGTFTLIKTSKYLRGYKDKELKYGKVCHEEYSCDTRINKSHIMTDNQQNPLNSEEIVSIDCGYSSTFIKTKDKLFATGFNGHGNLGLNAVKPYIDQLIPVYLERLGLKPDSFETCCGEHHSVIYTAKQIFVCGLNDTNQLGLADNKNRMQFEPVKSLPLAADEMIRNIICNTYHTIVLTTHYIYVCGLGSDGVLKPEKQSLFSSPKCGFRRLPIPIPALDIVNIVITYDDLIILTHDNLYTYRDGRCTEVELPKYRPTPVPKVMYDYQNPAYEGVIFKP